MEKASDMVEKLQASRDFGLTRSYVQPETRAIRGRAKGSQGVVNQVVQIREDASESALKLKVEFDLDSARLRPVSYGLLDELGTALNDTAVARDRICIKGHTDSDGEEEYNLKLSYERAGAVMDYLVGHHRIAPSRLYVAGYGEGAPLMANTSRENKQKNRRVELSLYCPEIFE